MIRLSKEKQHTGKPFVRPETARNILGFIGYSLCMFTVVILLIGGVLYLTAPSEDAILIRDNIVHHTDRWVAEQDEKNTIRFVNHTDGLIVVTDNSFNKYNTSVWVFDEKDTVEILQRDFNSRAFVHKAMKKHLATSPDISTYNRVIGRLKENQPRSEG